MPFTNRSDRLEILTVRLCARCMNSVFHCFLLVEEQYILKLNLLFPAFVYALPHGEILGMRTIWIAKKLELGRKIGQPLVKQPGMGRLVLRKLLFHGSCLTCP